MFDFLGDIGGGLFTVLKVAGPAVAAGMVQKHVTKIPNNAIPWINGIGGTILGTVMSGGDIAQGVQLGAAVATSGTGLHQLLKLGTRWATKGQVSSI